MTAGLARPGRRAAAVVAAVVVAGAVTSCSAAHPSLGLGTGSVSDCFRALPAATRALHDPGADLVGVKRLPADMVEHRFGGPATTGTVPAPTENDTTVCAVAFRGAFKPGQVDGAPPAEQGGFAVVLVTSRQLKLVRSFVGPRLPERFARLLA
ncbi:MAG: hypothetical protein ACRDY0_03255 [Acidimicrobiales bacterium]